MLQVLKFVSCFCRILACLYILEAVGLAQSTKLLGQDKTNSSVKAENNEKEDSPRYMFRQFLNVLKRNDVEAAMSYVEFPRRWNSERRRNTTRQLIDVLNKRARINLGELSSEVDGRTSDGQAPDIEIIGQVYVGRETVPVTLVQVTQEDRKVWHFASEFIDRIPALAEKMEQSDIEADMPEILVDNQFYGIKLWQWLSIALALTLASLVSRGLALVLLKIINLTSRRFKIFLADESLKGFIPPLRMLTGIALFKLAINSVDLHLDVRQTLAYIMTMLLTLTFIFLAMRLTEALMDWMRLAFDRQGRPGSAAMLQPTQRGLKAVIIVVGIIFLLRNFGLT
jgi:MscS family membrane protein